MALVTQLDGYLIGATWFNNIKDILVGSTSSGVNATAIRDQPLSLYNNLTLQAQSSPPTAPTAAVVPGGSGLGIGVYTYAVGYANSNGSTLPGTTTTATTTAGNQAVNLTAIPTGPTGCTLRYLYRGTVGSTTLLLLATIGDNTTTTYNDTVVDGSLGAAAPTKGTFGGCIFVKDGTGATKFTVYSDGTYSGAAGGGVSFGADITVGGNIYSTGGILTLGSGGTTSTLYGTTGGLKTNQGFTTLGNMSISGTLASGALTVTGIAAVSTKITVPLIQATSSTNTQMGTFTYVAGIAGDKTAFQAGVSGDTIGRFQAVVRSDGYGQLILSDGTTARNIYAYASGLQTDTLFNFTNGLTVSGTLTSSSLITANQINAANGSFSGNLSVTGSLGGATITAVNNNAVAAQTTANAAQTTANAALPLTGGTLTGNTTVNATFTALGVINASNLVNLSNTTTVSGTLTASGPFVSTGTCTVNSIVSATGTNNLVLQGNFIGFKTQGGTKLAEFKNNGDLEISGQNAKTTNTIYNYGVGGSFDTFDYAEVYTADTQHAAGTVVCPGDVGVLVQCTHVGCPCAMIVSAGGGFTIGNIEEYNGVDALIPIALMGRVRILTDEVIASRQSVSSAGNGKVRVAQPGDTVIGFALHATDNNQVGVFLRN